MSSSPHSGSELAVMIPALDEASNLAELLPAVRAELDRLQIAYALLVVDGGSTDDTRRIAADAGARVVESAGRGYGGALRAGFAATEADFVLTMDADFSHRPELVADLWRRRHEGELLIASRWAAGGSAAMSRARTAASRALNAVFRRLLALPVRDCSSGFRLYRRAAVAALPLAGRDFDVLEEILVRGLAAGWHVVEVPFHYAPRRHGASHVRLLRFGWSFARTLLRLMRLRRRLAAAQRARPGGAR